MIEGSRGGGRATELHPLWRWFTRNVWLIVLAVVGGAATGFVVANSASVTFESERIVVASATDISAESFGNLAETVFETDTVLAPVIEEVGLQESSESLLRSGRVALEPVSNAAAVRIIGRSPDATLAARLATSAARSFTATAEDRGMGRFEVFGGTGGPAQATTPSPLLWAVLGGAAGGVIALLLLLFVSFVREPVLSEDEARGELPVDAAFGVRVRRRARGRGRRSRDWLVSPAGVETSIWRALDVGSRVSGRGAGEGAHVSCVLVERGRRDHAWLGAVVDYVVEASRGHGEEPARLSVFRWNSLGPEEGEMIAALERAAAIVLLIAEGTSGKVLSDLNEVIQSFSQGRRVLVLARLRGSWRGRVGRIADSGNGLESDRGSPVGVIADDGAVPGSEEERVEDLTAALSHPSAKVRLRALKALSRRPTAEALEAVAFRLRDPEPRVRSSAVRTLRAMNDDRASLALLDAVVDPSEKVGAAAREAIVAGSSKKVADRLVEQLQSEERRDTAATLLRQMGSVATEALTKAERKARGVSRQTIRDVLESLDAEGASSPSPRRGGDLREDLSSKGVSEAVDALVQRLADPDPEVRIEAAQVLGELGAPQAVEPLQRSMAAEPQMSVAFAIAQALRKLGRPVRERGGS